MIRTIPAYTLQYLKHSTTVCSNTFSIIHFRHYHHSHIGQLNIHRNMAGHSANPSEGEETPSTTPGTPFNESDKQTNVSDLHRRMQNGSASKQSSKTSSVALKTGLSFLPEGAYRPRYIDVGINLTDDMYNGYYNGRKHHEGDLDEVIERAKNMGCVKMMVTGSNVAESQHAIDIAKAHPGSIYATVGVHPCSVNTLEKHPADIETLEKLAQEGKAAGTVTAFGEIGLDYDRLYHASKDTQLKFFAAQLCIAEKLDLPLFLHSRAAAEDFERLLFDAKLPRKGLVHSFTGGLDEMKRLVAAGYDIGVNGCSLKTQENLDVVKEIPMERMQIETDGPWCQIRPTHVSAAYLKDMPDYLKAEMIEEKKKEKFEVGKRVKGRNEPCAISEVAWVVAKVKDISFEEVCEKSWENSMKMFKFEDMDKVTVNHSVTE